MNLDMNVVSSTTKLSKNDETFSFSVSRRPYMLFHRSPIACTYMYVRFAVVWMNCVSLLYYISPNILVYVHVLFDSTIP